MTRFGMLLLASLLLACDQPGGRGLAPIDGAVDGVGSDASEVAGDDLDPGPDALDDAQVPADTTPADTTPADTIPADTGPADTGPAGPPPITSPTCIDGAFDEALPLASASLDALIANYSASDYQIFAQAVLAARYPFGASLVSRALEADGFGNCIEQFTSDRGTARGLMGELSTVVHECGHVVDLAGGTFTGSLYVVSDDVSLTCTGGDATGRGGDTFARSRLNDDAYGPLLPDDFYRDVYLDGSPDDAAFDSGDQGFDSVLEEALQYINSLATDWALKDNLGGTFISSRDGALTFLWYVERYLHMARTSYPAAYERLSGDACWRRAILTVWGRAWLYLDLSRNVPQLGLDDDTIEALVLAPELLAEIDLLRGVQGCSR